MTQQTLHGRAVQCLMRSFLMRTFNRTGSARYTVKDHVESDDVQERDKFLHGPKVARVTAWMATWIATCMDFGMLVGLVELLVRLKSRGGGGQLLDRQEVQRTGKTKVEKGLTLYANRKDLVSPIRIYGGTIDLVRGKYRASCARLDFAFLATCCEKSEFYFFILSSNTTNSLKSSNIVGNLGILGITRQCCAI